jgi:hypothetical protein
MELNYSNVEQLPLDKSLNFIDVVGNSSIKRLIRPL